MCIPHPCRLGSMKPHPFIFREIEGTVAPASRTFMVLFKKVSSTREIAVNCELFVSSLFFFVFCFFLLWGDMLLKIVGVLKTRRL